jgi:hypothetical protein
MPPISRRSLIAGTAALPFAPRLLRACMPTTTDPPPVLDLQPLINDAVESGAAVLALPPGRFRLAEPVYVYAANGLVIDGTNTTLVATFAQPGRTDAIAWWIEQCTNLVFRGLTMDFDPLPFTQGSIAAVDRVGGLVDLAVHAGYRRDVQFFKEDISVGDSLKLHAFSAADLTVKRGHAFAIASSVDEVEPGLLRFDVGADNASAFDVGDLAATGCWRFSAFQTLRSSGMVFDGVNIWASGGAAILERDGDGGSDVRVRIEPGPAPTGAGEARLISCSRDAYHAGDLRRGPDIHDSVITGAGDDMIHVFMNPLFAESVDTATSTVQVTGRNWRMVPTVLRVGDTLSLRDTETRAEIARTAITAIERIDEGTARLTVADISGFAEGITLHVPELGGNGLRVRDCTLTNGVSAAIMIKSPGTRVTGNTITGFGQAGMTVATDFDSWWGAPFATDVEVSGNHIVDIGRSRIFSAVQYGLGAAIVIGVEDAERPDLIATRSFRDIRIVGNTIDGSPVWGILVSNADGVELRDNQLLDTNNAPPGTAGAFWDVTPAEVVYVRDSQNVVLAGNVASRTGEYATALVRVAVGSQAGPLDERGIRAG